MNVFPVPLTLFEKPQYNPLSEIFQSIDIKFAYVDKRGYQVHLPCKCRDFLGDMIWSRKTGKDVAIYGMRYSFSKSPYDEEVTRLSLRFPDQQTYDNFKRNFSFLTDKEKQYNIPESKLYLSSEKELIIEGDKVWQSNVWKLSIYTFYIKLMGYHNPEQPEQPEHGYWVKYKDLENKFLSNIWLDIDDTHTDLDMAHNYSGFYTAIYRPQYSKISKYILDSSECDESDDDDDDFYDEDD